MPSLLPGYEYDIFISYRQKDNKGDMWVTEFVNALKTEIEATFKEDISIYFDENPHDGLLETHNVNKSLEGKLKCLVFIPIISQTYCDPRSFAWQEEFCAFNRMAKVDSLGRDITLANGNVASRILPVKIHDLDPSDRSLLENELGTVLRAIEFIYRRPGVNRPLTLSDKKEDNSAKTVYRDQVNKVANAVKELISALRNSTTSLATDFKATDSRGEAAPAKQPSRKFALVTLALVMLMIAAYLTYQFIYKEDSPLEEISIAVLPFVNMSNDPGQEYFSDGLTTDLIGKLGSFRSLRVISRTSVMVYKKTEKKAPDIAAELGVKFLLEGTVQREGDDVRVTARLIDGKTDRQIWSQTIGKKIKDLLPIQAELAEQIARYFQITISTEERGKLQSIPTQSIEAYDLYLRARELVESRRRTDERAAIKLLLRAVQIDPGFSDAMALLAIGYWFRDSYYVGEASYNDSLSLWANRSYHASPTSPEALLALGYASLAESTNQKKPNAWSNALPYFIRANRLDPSLANRQIGLAFQFSERYDSAVFYFNQGLRYHPNDPKFLLQKGVIFFDLSLMDSAENMIQIVRQISPKEHDLFVLTTLSGVGKGQITQLLSDLETMLINETDSFLIQSQHAILSNLYAHQKEWSKAKAHLVLNPFPDSLTISVVEFHFGRKDVLDKYLRSLLSKPGKIVDSLSFDIAILHQVKGNSDSAIWYLERWARSSRDNMDPQFYRAYDAIANEIMTGPGYDDLVRRHERWRQQKLAEVMKIYKK